MPPMEGLKAEVPTLKALDSKGDAKELKNTYIIWSVTSSWFKRLVILEIRVYLNMYVTLYFHE